MGESTFSKLAGHPNGCDDRYRWQLRGHEVLGMEVSCRPASLYSGRGERRAWVLPLVAKNPRSSRRPGSAARRGCCRPGPDEAFNQSPAGYGSRLRGPAPSSAQPRPRPEEARAPLPSCSAAAQHAEGPLPDRSSAARSAHPKPPPRAPQKTPGPSRPAPPRGKLCCGALPTTAVRVPLGRMWRAPGGSWP